ncbi:hypothetical protein CC1G_04992 [Coprinopsis cinerea okayama7|uniref:Uncharacterized protein n=1 Tax=Coprinopsis cinerea (strain Okayama-7 / 130 / ATCC MYA-4618 / FGSC 9003) TaxID=240176 RepID=A8NSF3_COPC7|nr:hypothetical protein CC1G_04992 [Coprinopsis cinerea okayama7\|eukprot:XP_001835999.1 hypothetical protein CC1G_04992 [Coprinopsis cinerea okayama7\
MILIQQSQICDPKIRMVGSTTFDVDEPSTAAIALPSLPRLPAITPPSLLDSLPLEILHEIFVLCLPEDFRKEASGNNGPPAPLKLCHVSQTWRRAAISEPRLWRNLRLPTKRLEASTSLDSFTSTIAKLTAQAVFWFENAGDAGIRLVLDIPRPAFETADAGSVVTMLDGGRNVTNLPTELDLLVAWRKFVAVVLVQRASRIRSLELRPFTKAASACIAPFISPDLSQDFKRLDSVFIIGSQLPVSSCAGCHAKGLFGNAPSLKKVALVFSSIASSLPPSILPDTFLPWKQLTHLMIKMPCSGSFWKRVLLQCGQLETCVMHLEHSLIAEDRDPTLTDAGIVLPKLHRLDVTFHDEFSSIYFHPFRFPALTNISIACDIGNGFPTFIWLKQSKPHLYAQFKQLTSLTLSYQNITWSDLLELLKETDDLEELFVDSYLLDHKAFLQALTVYPDQTAKPIIPKLKNFSLFLEYYAETPPTTFEEQDLLVMMASRSPVASEVARHICIMNSIELPELYSARDPGVRVFAPDRLVSTSLGCVELWVDSEDGTKVELLEKFQQLTEALAESDKSDEYPPFSFLVDFVSPSEWLVQSNEPIWYSYY